ncbi:MAG: hypothetical protein ACLUIQ_11625 [Dialister invisus]
MPQLLLTCTRPSSKSMGTWADSRRLRNAPAQSGRRSLPASCPARTWPTERGLGHGGLSVGASLAAGAAGGGR